MTPTISESLARLSRAWPTAQLPQEAKIGYVEACGLSDPRDVADAVHRLTTGRVQRAYPELIPPPGAVAAEILKSRNARLDDEAKSRPRLPPPPTSKPSDAAQRKADVDRLLRPFREMRANKGLTDAEHEAAKRKTVAEALGMDEAEFNAKLATLPDRIQAQIKEKAA